MEPVSLTLAGIGGLALTEGVKFLYAEAQDLIKHWMDAKKSAGDSAAALPPVQVEVELPPAFAGQLQSPSANLAVIAKNEDRFEALTGALSLYATGTKPIEPSDRKLLAKADELRGLLEEIFGQNLTFAGEERPATGTRILRGTVNVDVLHGTAAGVSTDTLADVTEGHATAREVTGSIFGVEVKAKPRDD
jgi:hypothetical protein